MNFRQSVETCFKKYIVFNGRAKRSEYWWFILFGALLGFVCSLLDVAVFGLGFDSYGPIYAIGQLAILIPTFSVGARRLHDVNKSGWFLLIFLIPIIGTIIILVMVIEKGTLGKNRFGEYPLKFK